MAKRNEIRSNILREPYQIVKGHPIYVCTRANHARYLSVHVTFCEVILEKKNLTGRKCLAYETGRPLDVFVV